MQIRKIVFVCLVCMLAGVTGQAEELSRLTLKEAITQGLERNNQIRAVRFQAEAAHYGARAASLHYLPSVTVEETWSRSNVPVNTFMMKLNQGRFTEQDFAVSRLNNPSPVSDFRTAVVVEQPLLVPVLWAGQKVARHGEERQEAISELTSQQIAFKIFHLYLEVQKAHAYLLSSEKALEEARESRRQAIVRTAAGLGLKSDELRAETHLAAMEQQKISSSNNLTLARMQLALTIGRQPGDEVDTSETAILKKPGQDINSLAGLAQQERREIHAAEKGKDQADAAALQSKAGFLPSLGAIGSWQMNDSNTPFGRQHDSWMAGISLRWNIFDGFRTMQGAGQARASLSAAVENLEQTRKDVDYQIREAWLRRIEAEKRLKVAASAVASAEEAVRLLSKRFDNALAMMVELLDAQSALNQARANLVESEAGLTLATGRLYHAAGIFLKEVL